MIRINGIGTISFEDVKKLCAKYPQNEIIIVIPNTKEQSVEELQKIASRYPKVTFSVLGGLDPKKKKKFESYQYRTYFSARELSKIVEIYRGIEKQIDLGWTETQKAMFIYMKLCNMMEYSEIEVNGRDYSRGIGGLIYRKAVCSGFAMILKEALDRVGIECHYQNKRHHHSWNIAKLDGEYRALELTWDTCNKGKDGCGFYFFNRDNEQFYANKHHDISREDEEHEFPVVPYTTKELQENYRVISQKRIVKVPLDVSHTTFTESGKITINGICCVIRKEKDGKVTLVPLEKQEVKSKMFVREDGQHFVLVPLKRAANDLNAFIIIEESQVGVQVGKIFSEEQLIDLPKEYDQAIANGLLSHERLGRKINDFNGYVGYVGRNHSIYYSQRIEREKLNVIR